MKKAVDIEKSERDIVLFYTWKRIESFHLEQIRGIY